jgi:hypothetical protein
MLLSDTFHLVGFNIFDRNQIIEQKKIEKKKKLIGLGSQNNQTFWSTYNNITNMINNNKNGSNMITILFQLDFLFVPPTTELNL